MSDEITPREAAKLLGVTRQSITRWIKIGRLPAKRVGLRGWRIQRSDLAKVISTSEGEQDAPKKANALAA